MVFLETQRLIIREMRHSDVESLRSSAQYGFGLWALTLKGSDEAIGDCGLAAIKEVEGAAETQIGWHVRRDLWGQGLATEAARACRDYGFDHLGLERLWALIHPENIASRRVAEKIGMSLLRQIQHRGKTRCLYGMERPQG